MGKEANSNIERKSLYLDGMMTAAWLWHHLRHCRIMASASQRLWTIL